MSTDLVPADNMAALDGMDAPTRELAVTNMLTEARSWLAHAVEATEPQAIANFKAQMATVAEATKQLGGLGFADVSLAGAPMLAESLGDRWVCKVKVEYRHMPDPSVTLRGDF